jgi:hypothetical protein
MKIRIKTQESTYFLKLMMILNNIPPFNKLRPKELELYAHLLSVNHKYRNIPFKERNKLIFNYDTKIDIANLMGVKLSGVYNILSNLRLLKIIDGESLIPKYILSKEKELIFLFEDED